MRRVLLSLTTFILVLSGFSDLFAITDEEIFRNFQFSFLNPGARSSAMGGAFIALADDATAAEANPAGLTILTKPEVSFEYRNTQYDSERLNSFNAVSAQGVDTFISSFNNLKELNQPSFLSIVFPSGNSTYAFSRHESVRLIGGIDEFFSFFFVDEFGNPQSLDWSAFATAEQTVVNYNFSYATKLTEGFSIGASLRYARLEWNTAVQNFFGSFDRPSFQSAIDGQDSGFAYNIGAIYNFGSHFSVGAVFKQNPKFEITEVVSGPDIGGSFPFQNIFKVPDTFGFGIAIKPNDNMSITLDGVRIQYSDLMEGFEAGLNIITIGYTNDSVQYHVKDATEFHVGAEFVVFLGSVPVALRQGYYRKPSNSLLPQSTTGLDPLRQVIVETIFSEREVENHFTIGNGFVFGSHFQVDWALDLADSTDNFVLSTVVRF